ncbi:MAG: heme o synthase [Candidatus Kariarchaeaceae archaeon]|jgi:protoheme IX farnesyltransferase
MRYLSLTKPRIIVLLTITGIGGFFLDQPNFDGIKFFDIPVFILIGYLSAGGAMTINAYIDRDIDIMMERTKTRSSVGSDAIDPPEKVLIFGSIFVIIALAIGGLYFNVLTALFLGWGAFFYLFGYSLYLKRKSILNTILGGLASPAPVWAGVAARTGEIGLEGWLLGALVFIWTPSHTWALSTKHMDDYAAVNIPMLPVKLGKEKTARITFYFGLVVIAYGVWLTYWLADKSVLVTVVATTIPNIVLFYGLWIFLKQPTKQSANRCFKMHNAYLAMMFAVILIFLW